MRIIKEEKFHIHYWYEIKETYGDYIFYVSNSMKQSLRRDDVAHVKINIRNNITDLRNHFNSLHQ